MSDKRTGRDDTAIAEEMAEQIAIDFQWEAKYEKLLNVAN